MINFQVGVECEICGYVQKAAFPRHNAAVNQVAGGDMHFQYQTPNGAIELLPMFEFIKLQRITLYD